MGEVKVQNYLNPITLEADLFVKTFEKLSVNFKYIDKNVIHALNKVVTSIEKFLEQNNQEIVDTKQSRLVERAEMAGIEQIYRCSKCKTDLGKSIERAAEHVATKCKNKGAPKSLKKKKKERPIALSKKTKSLLTADLNKFFTDHLLIADKLKSIPEYDVIETQLLSLVKPLFPNEPLRVYRFGSRLTGIGERDSDVDIFLDIGDTFKIFENRASQGTIEKLKKVFKAMKNVPKIWKIVVKVDKARVPIIKAYNDSTGIECDIGFSNSLGVLNTKLIEHIFEIQPIARHMCLFLKWWLRRTGLNEDYSTYSIVLMVIYFLQMREVVPSVEFLQKRIDFNKAISIGPWLGTFVSCTLNEIKMEEVPTTATNVQMHLKLFFEFYLQFDFKTNVVCPYLGKLVKIVELEKQMPTWYTYYVECSPADRMIELKKAMIVQDPIQLNHNVTKGVEKSRFRDLIEYMRLSTQIIPTTKKKE
ncbi:terminal uridylyltransferase Tailor-like isoform X1 [Glossina fuscipes]|uniref:Terminal uridylyltransferase Tailor-like isoform X1 n=1 Tax=Glossina fuscipes TaxID=7396 RepID=A0A9C5ZIT8_9MUSC|nr:terminal uridylyltransferase Tailor-like isoform X1 [Glossina fuscipes]